MQYILNGLILQFWNSGDVMFPSTYGFWLKFSFGVELIEKFEFVGFMSIDIID